MIDGARRERRIGSAEACLRAAPEAHGSRFAQRNADHMFERGAVAMPADTRTWIITDQQQLLELVRLQTREPRCTGLEARRPLGIGSAGAKTPV